MQATNSPLICPRCGKQTDNDENLEKHLSAAHGIPTGSQAINRLVNCARRTKRTVDELLNTAR